MNRNIALVIIDVQAGMFDLNPPLYKGNELLNNIKKLINLARESDTPVIYIQHDGESDKHPLHPDKPGWLIHPDIYPIKGDAVIRKRHPDAFQETTLQNELNKIGIQNLVLAGIQTEYCVDTTCRSSYSLGYKVTLVQDAHSTWDTEHLKAVQIIDHHNKVLSDWFVTLKTTDMIQFNN